MAYSWGAEDYPYQVDLAFLLYQIRSGFKKQIYHADVPELLDQYAPGWYYDKVHMDV